MIYLQWNIYDGNGRKNPTADINWTPSIYWCCFPTSGHPNQKPSEQHSQDNHITSGLMNRTSRPRHALFAIARTKVRFRLARQSLLFYLWECGNSHSLLPPDPRSLSHSPVMSSLQNVQLGAGLFVRALLRNEVAVASYSAKSHPSTQQSPLMGSSCFILVSVSISIFLRWLSFVSSSQPVIILSQRFM